MVRQIAALLLTLLAFTAGAARSAQAGALPDRSALYAQLEKADAVVEGARTAKTVLYVFFDANCFYCHLTWKALQPYEAAGLQVRWVPVAYQQPSSAGRAAAIMEAADPAAALRQNESGYDTGRYAGGLAPTPTVAPAVLARLDADTRLMRSFGAPGTPALVWQDRQGLVRVKVGVPGPQDLRTITGLAPAANQ